MTELQNNYLRIGLWISAQVECSVINSRTDSTLPVLEVTDRVLFGQIWEF